MRGVLWNPYRQEPTDPQLARETPASSSRTSASSSSSRPDALKNITEWVKPVPVLVADWHARKVAASELRGLLKMFGDLMQRVHDAEQVQAFQEAMMESIREASPEVAAAVIANLRKRQTVRRAAILGIPG
jgi:hypothetical protein